MKLVITRPLLDAKPLASELERRGHEVVVAPLLEIIARDGVEVPRGPFQAICVTSANSVRSLAGAIDPQIPVITVGPQSAAAALARGFQNVSAQGGDVHGLVGFITSELKPDDGGLLYLSGAETSGDLQGELQASGFDVARLITYDAVPQDLEKSLKFIVGCDGVLLYSRRSARLWLGQLGEQAREMIHFCLSGQIAALLPNHFSTRIAINPTEAAMLDLLDLGGKAE